MKTERYWESHSMAETEAIGRSLGECVKPGQVYGLDGDLGTGKTVLARGFARGLGITQDIMSPTFTIVHEYREGRIPLFHFDVYRLTDEDALWEIGWEDYLDASGVCLVEWASQRAESMPAETRWIRIEKDLSQGTEYRRIVLTSGEQI